MRMLGLIGNSKDASISGQSECRELWEEMSQPYRRGQSHRVLNGQESGFYPEWGGMWDRKPTKGLEQRSDRI